MAFSYSSTSDQLNSVGLFQANWSSKDYLSFPFPYPITPQKFKAFKENHPLEDLYVQY